MPKHAFLYLASQSPRRLQLLQQIGARCELLLPTDAAQAEALEAPLAGELPEDYVQRVTQLKLRAAVKRLRQNKLPAAPVLCADTTVAVGRRILGKPVDAADAAQMLQRLSGRTHRVLSAVAVHDGKRVLQALSTSKVRFMPLPQSVIDLYVASGEPFGKAGSYAIQGPMAGWIEHISGSYSGIMGLPLCQSTQILRSAGLSLPLGAP